MATINIQELSEALNTTPRTARKFLRSVTPVEDQPGKGSRWQIEKRQVRTLKKQFEEYTEQHIRQVETPADQIDEVEALEEADELIPA